MTNTQKNIAENKTYKVDFINLKSNRSYFHPIRAQTPNRARKEFIAYMKRNNSIINKDYKIELISSNLMGFYSD